MVRTALYTENMLLSLLLLLLHAISRTGSYSDCELSQVHRGQTRTEHNPVASAFTCTSHAAELDCSPLFLFLSTSNYTMLVG